MPTIKLVDKKLDCIINALDTVVDVYSRTAAALPWTSSARCFLIREVAECRAIAFKLRKLPSLLNRKGQHTI